MDVALTSFALGLLATTSPCLLPLYPGFLAYLSGQAGSDNGRLRKQLAPGSGVLITADSLVLSNCHMVRQTVRATVHPQSLRRQSPEPRIRAARCPV